MKTLNSTQSKSLNTSVLVISSILIFTLNSCSYIFSGGKENDDEIEAGTSVFDNPLEGMGEVQIVASDFGENDTQGIVWHKASGSIIFSSVSDGNIYSYNVNSQEVTTLVSSLAPNGLALYNDNFLLIAKATASL